MGTVIARYRSQGQVALQAGAQALEAVLRAVCGRQRSCHSAVQRKKRAECSMTGRSYELGHGHTMTFTSRYGSPPDEHCGAIVSHLLRDDDEECAWKGYCSGYVEFDIAANAEDIRDKWQVVSMDPLTLAPSLLCHCGDHGFIQNGRWVWA